MRLLVILGPIEKQYDNVYMLSGEPVYQEKVVGKNSHIMI